MFPEKDSVQDAEETDSEPILFGPGKSFPRPENVPTLQLEGIQQECEEVTSRKRENSSKGKQSLGEESMSEFEEENQSAVEEFKFMFSNVEKLDTEEVDS